jgi:hypothetical protein
MPVKAGIISATVTMIEFRDLCDFCCRDIVHVTLKIGVESCDAKLHTRSTLKILQLLLAGIMHIVLRTISDELDAVADLVVNSSAELRTVPEITGAWHNPTLNRDQLASIPRALAAAIREANVEEISDEDTPILNSVFQSISQLKPTITQHLATGNASVAVPAFMLTLDYCTKTIGPILRWTVPQSKALPAQLTRRLHKTQQDLENIIPDVGKLKQDVALITSARETADSLPTTLQDLKLAEEKLSKALLNADSYLEKISNIENSSNNELTSLQNSALEAKQLISQCEEAYRATTTKGLAGAFSDRARNLTYSLYGWLAAFVLTIAFGMYVGYFRLKDVTKLLEAGQPDFIRIWVQMAVSVISVAGPFWLAWIATKQISQRFRLVEDYAFKATVAKAYEGYRREAASMDPELAKRLFSSALTRLDEAPLRLLDNSTHGSPLHELANSDVIGKVTSQIGGLVDIVRKSPG